MGLDAKPSLEDGKYDEAVVTRTIYDEWIEASADGRRGRLRTRYDDTV